MTQYAIIETDEGLTVMELQPGLSAEDAAVRHHGAVVIDPGPYRAYDDAYDAILALENDDDEHDLR